jgi:hypothetical protein
MLIWKKVKVNEILIVSPEGQILKIPNHIWEDIIKIFWKRGYRTWSGFISLEIGIGGGCLETRSGTHGFHKRWRIT